MRYLIASLICGAFVVGPSFVASAQETKNLLKKTNDTESWNFETHEDGKGSIKATKESIVFSSDELPGENWHVQVYQVDLDLKSGTKYKVAFEVRAPKSREISLSAMLNEDPWESIGLDESIYATKEWKKHEFTFTAVDASTTKQNRIGFRLGEDVGPVEIKNMTLTVATDR